MKVAHCLDLDCSGATTATVDGVGSTGGYPSITVGIDDMPLISYFESSANDIKVAHCANPFCVPYFRRR